VIAATAPTTAMTATTLKASEVSNADP
jgi:hypothetical protein